MKYNTYYNTNDFCPTKDKIIVTDWHTNIYLCFCKGNAYKKVFIYSRRCLYCVDFTMRNSTAVWIIIIEL